MYQFKKVILKTEFYVLALFIRLNFNVHFQKLIFSPTFAIENEEPLANLLANILLAILLSILEMYCKLSHR